MTRILLILFVLSFVAMFEFEQSRIEKLHELIAKTC